MPRDENHKVPRLDIGALRADVSLGMTQDRKRFIGTAEALPSR